MSILRAYRRPPSDSGPPYDFAPYASTHKRAPRNPPIRIAHTLSEITGPRPGTELAPPKDVDLTHHEGGEALGERIIVSGRVLDEDGRAIANALIEIWQANAAGRYAHDIDKHDAPLDRHFTGVGRVATDSDGVYRFTTIKPGAYPWKNHHNAWRPQHIHFGLFGPGFATRLITQMYFPGDPLLKLDPIFQSVPDAAARERLICSFDIATTVPEWALGYRFDVVLRGREATPTEAEAGGRRR
jgi:protocatechuate 3,4-dioxygenase, beta subunit